MKILIATGIFPPDIGGPATYVAQFMAACPRYGHTATVVVYPRTYPPLIRHVLFFFTCLRAGYSADVVFAQGTISAGFPAACAAYILGKRFIVRVAGDFAWEYAMNRKITSYSIDDFQKHSSPSLLVIVTRFVQRRVCMVSTHIIVPSAHLKDIVLGWGVSAKKVTIIRNAVIGHDALRTTDSPSSSCVILSAGRMVPWKGFTSLIRVCAAIAADFPHLRLVIAGNGPCREDLLNTARLCGIADRVVFLHAVSIEKMVGLYAEASCFVLFSDYEGLPHVILEALSHKVPVIVSDILGNREIISPRINGMLVQRGDERALKEALRAFLRDPKKEVPFPGFIAGDDFTHNTMMIKVFAVMEKNE